MYRKKYRQFQNNSQFGRTCSGKLFVENNRQGNRLQLYLKSFYPFIEFRKKLHSQICRHKYNSESNKAD